MKVPAVVLCAAIRSVCEKREIGVRLARGQFFDRFCHVEASSDRSYGGAILSCPRGAAKRTRIGNSNSEAVFTNGWRTSTQRPNSHAASAPALTVNSLLSYRKHAVHSERRSFQSYDE